MKKHLIVAVGFACLLSACGQPGLVASGPTQDRTGVKANAVPWPGGTDLNGETDRDRAFDAFHAYLKKTYPQSPVPFVASLTKPSPGATYQLRAEIRDAVTKKVALIVLATLSPDAKGRYSVTSVQHQTP